MKSRNRAALFLIALFPEAAIVLASIVVVGCHSSYNSSGNTSQATTYAGTLTGSGGASGTISLTITPAMAATGAEIMPLAASSDTVAGTLHLIAGGTVNLTGTFTSPSGPLDVSGGGYVFTGMIQNGVLGGTWTGSAATGTFSTLVSGTYSTVTNFCGTFAGTDSGTWDLSQLGSILAGSYSGTSGSAVLTGTINGMTISLTYATGTAQGTLSGSSMSGTWTSGSHNGTWQGSTTGCN